MIEPGYKDFYTGPADSVVMDFFGSKAMYVPEKNWVMTVSDLSRYATQYGGIEVWLMQPDGGGTLHGQSWYVLSHIGDGYYNVTYGTLSETRTNGKWRREDSKHTVYSTSASSPGPDYPSSSYSWELVGKKRILN